jgi:NADPH-dependent 2,4-dienoyl-CoA reductase/sulfur reductase-like enzyme
MAEAFIRRGLSVTMLHQHALPLPHLGPKAALHVRETLTRQGVVFVPEARVVGFQGGPQQRVTHVYTDNKSFPADVVITAVGVRPNTGLAAAVGIQTGRFGGVVVDTRLRTSVDTIFAAGDCCEVRNLLSNRSMLVPLATLASRMGSVAGENAAGGRAVYSGALRAIAIRCFNLELAHVGLTVEEAREAGMVPETATIESTSSAHMMPGSKALFVTLMVDRTSRRIIGADLWGESGAVLRAHALAVAIQHRLTVEDAQKLDLPYAPPFSPLWDPIIIAANAMARVLARPQARPPQRPH